jgi:hypothetical protein
MVNRTWTLMTKSCPGQYLAWLVLIYPSATPALRCCLLGLLRARCLPLLFLLLFLFVQYRFPFPFLFRPLLPQYRFLFRRMFLSWLTLNSVVLRVTARLSFLST